MMSKPLKNFFREFEIDGKHYTLKIVSETDPKVVELNVGKPLPYKPKTFKEELTLDRDWYSGSHY